LQESRCRDAQGARAAPEAIAQKLSVDNAKSKGGVSKQIDATTKRVGEGW